MSTRMVADINSDLIRLPQEPERELRERRLRQDFGGREQSGAAESEPQLLLHRLTILVIKDMLLSTQSLTLEETF